MKTIRILRNLCFILFVMLIGCFCSFAASATVTEESLKDTHFQIDWKPTAGSYWNSTSSQKINTANTPFNNQYMASEIRFTKDMLPVGSYIFVDSGYHYRPEGWQNSTSVNSGARPDNVATSCVKVTEEWGGSFTVRAFHIQNNESSKRYTVEGDSASYSYDLRANFDEAKNKLRIYVPNGTTGVEPYAELVKLDLELTSGFYSSEGTSYNINTGSDLAKQFWATVIFTRETLPVGSVIEVDSGYKYRPDGWIDLNTKNTHSTKPGNVSTASVTVTEDWWGDWTYRGFNISTNAQGDISENYLEVASHFNITLPDGRKYVHPNLEEEEPEEPVEPVNPVVIPEAEEGVVRILSIGNSYSNDAQAYTHKIAEGLGIKAEFYNLYYGGCTIDQHYNFYNNDNANYIFYRNMTKYVSVNVTLKNVLEAAQFDIITFQQGSYSSDKYSNYSKLDDLMAIVRSYQPNAEFMIHQTWGYCEERSLQKGYTTSADMFKKVEECYAQAAADNGNLTILKSGKAIETAKTKYGYTDDYGNTNSIYSDFNSHLAPKGDYIAGCVWIETIFGVDARNTSFTNNFVDADVLQEIAHIAVGNVYTGNVDINNNNDFGTPVIKTAEKDGFDYDGRARIVVLKGTEIVDTVYQNADGTMPEINLPEGTYRFRMEKNGYLAQTTAEITVKAGDAIILPEFELIAGDIKDDITFCGDGIIDIDDFTRVLRGFNSSATELTKISSDVNYDGEINVTDLNIIKTNLGRKSD